MTTAEQQLIDSITQARKRFEAVKIPSRIFFSEIMKECWSRPVWMGLSIYWISCGHGSCDIVQARMKIFARRNDTFMRILHPDDFSDRRAARLARQIDKL
jgi:hypothetical protein